MEYLVAKAPDPETGKQSLRPQWFSVEASNRNANVYVETYLESRDAKRNKATVVKCEITEMTN